MRNFEYYFVVTCLYVLGVTFAIATINAFNQGYHAHVFILTMAVLFIAWGIAEAMYDDFAGEIRWNWVTGLKT